MNFRCLRVLLTITMIGSGLAGCQSDSKKLVQPSSKPEDPTAWSGSEMTREGSSAQGLPKSSRLQGGLSSEANDIEKSLGVGR